MYIHERANWTAFRWDAAELTTLLEAVSHKRGRLYGRLATLSFDSKLKAMVENLTYDIVYSSEIEGIRLNVDEVRSSIARRLGIENIKQVGQYRTNEEHIVSGMFGREKIHYIAPSPARVEQERADFIAWFNAEENISSVVRSAIAHLWFVSIPPFEDGNGRLARILSEILLARADQSDFRFYNISSTLNKDKKHYYEILEKTQRGDGDITAWIRWYAQTLSAALDEAEAAVSTILNKSVFWQKVADIPLNQRQTDMLNRFLDDYEAKITSKKWEKLAKCSKDTAIRDLQDLVAKEILREDVPSAKRPSYSIIYDPDDITEFFSEIAVVADHDNHYLTALYKGRTPVRERLLPLDAERYQNGDLPLRRLLNKYCAYLRTT